MLLSCGTPEARVAVVTTATIGGSFYSTTVVDQFPSTFPAVFGDTVTVVIAQAKTTATVG